MAGALFAVVVKDACANGVVARIARRPSGIYYLIPRDGEDFDFEIEEQWDPHASYHADGMSHLKSFGRVVHLPVHRQPLGNSFSGSEPLFAQAFQPGELSRLRPLGAAASYNGVLEIPNDRFAISAHHTLAVDLVSPGSGRCSGPWQEVVLEHSFRDAIPWIHVTLWRGISGYTRT